MYTGFGKISRSRPGMTFTTANNNNFFVEFFFWRNKCEKKNLKKDRFYMSNKNPFSNVEKGCFQLLTIPTIHIYHQMLLLLCYWLLPSQISITTSENSPISVAHNSSRFLFWWKNTEPSNLFVFCQFQFPDVPFTMTNFRNVIHNEQKKNYEKKKKFVRAIKQYIDNEHSM